MSRSRKRTPVIKDSDSDGYWSTIRSRQKQDLKLDKDITNPKSIIDDYRYTDRKRFCKSKDCYCMKNFGRKKCLNK